MECEQVRSLHKLLEIALGHCPPHCEHGEKTRMQDWLTSFSTKNGSFHLILLFEAVEAAFWEVALLIFWLNEGMIWRWSTNLEPYNFISKLSRTRADPDKKFFQIQSFWRKESVNSVIVESFKNKPMKLSTTKDNQFLRPISKSSQNTQENSQPDSKRVDVPRSFRNSSILLRVASLSLSACVATITKHLSFRMALLKSLSAVHATPVSILEYQSLTLTGILHKARYGRTNVTFQNWLTPELARARCLFLWARPHQLRWQYN